MHQLHDFDNIIRIWKGVIFYLMRMFFLTIILDYLVEDSYMKLEFANVLIKWNTIYTFAEGYALSVYRPLH